MDIPFGLGVIFIAAVIFMGGFCFGWLMCEWNWKEAIKDYERKKRNPRG